MLPIVISLLVIVVGISAFMMQKQIQYTKPPEAQEADKLVVLFTESALKIKNADVLSNSFKRIFRYIEEVVNENSLKDKNQDIAKFITHLINTYRYSNKKDDFSKRSYYYVDAIICEFLAIYYTTVSTNIEIKYYLDKQTSNNTSNIMLTSINKYESLTNHIEKFKDSLYKVNNAGYVNVLEEAWSAMTKDIENYRKIYETNNFTDNFEISSVVINKMEVLRDYYKDNYFVN